MRTTQRMRTRWAAGLAAIALAATACGADDDGAAGETADEAPDEPADETDGNEPAEEATEEATEEDEPADGGETATEEPLTVYSGRAEELVGEALDGFTDETGIELEVRYGDTAELAATIINEGDATPADVYFGQDAGALGALQAEGLLATLPAELTDQVDPAFASETDEWIGTTGRVRVLSYNTDTLSEDEVPDSVLDLTDPEWEGRVSWAPTNGSFQAFITAMRLTEGEDVAQQWLEDMIANDVQVFENNASQVEAAGRGEIDIALVNHYYLARFTAEDPEFPVANKYLPGDIGGLLNVAGVGVLETTDQPDAAEEFVAYLLSEDVQNFFGTETVEQEFPAVTGIDAADLPSVEELAPPEVDLSALEDLQGTLTLLEDGGALE